ncbi:MAG: carbamoyl-phosphate synthase large subunit [bacterium]|nr:carbamoyl-phosphate synthase large subunit [bacterium]
MSKRTDIKKVLLIGSGPIVIGQACEFDYSGTQACRVLKQEGYEVILINSNPATIMTDPEVADKTYIEPINTYTIEKIIKKESPDVVLPTLGGQTALNAAVELYEQGILAKYNLELIGASYPVIKKAEDRNKFKASMQKIGLDLPQSGFAYTIEEAEQIANRIGTFPLIIRASFTLGGTGGGIVYNREEFVEKVRYGFKCSPVTEVLIEESIIGWKEYELELMRDYKDNVVIICSIENIDPMGVHTGDSITVAPAQTLSDYEYQIMRDAALKVIREIGVETGGSNIQFAVNPKNGRMVVIEMNPRVSRSSALASKATGFPIAKIAAKLAVGYALDEISNDITKETPASFEPTIDYCVVKIPRFTFEKFKGAKDELGISMQSVGETMALGRNFKESFQKGMRSLEIGCSGYILDKKEKEFSAIADAEMIKLVSQPSSERFFYIRSAFKRGWTLEKIVDLTGIDKWFLAQFKGIVLMEEEIKAKGINHKEFLIKVKQSGFSDHQIAMILNQKESDIRAKRKNLGVEPVYKLVDTCAAEFEAYTPYYYSSYDAEDEGF